MLHIIDIPMDDDAALARLGELVQRQDVLLLTGASLAWPDTQPLLAVCASHWRLDAALSDHALATLISDHGPVLSHFSDHGSPCHE